MNSSDGSLIEHLTELRIRIINAAYFILAGTALCYGFSEKIFDVIRKPVQKYLSSGGLVYTGPLDKFMAHIKLSIICGIILSCPFWLYQVWRFIAPGLYKNEKKYMLGFISAGTTLFLSGVSFSYFIVMPMAFEFLFNFGGSVDKPMITIDSYLGFFSQFCIMFGVSFELPLIISLLGMMGVVSQKFLIDKGRYAVMALAIISAVIAPPDLMSMVMMLVPMVILYYLGVLAVGFFEKKAAASE